MIGWHTLLLLDLPMQCKGDSVLNICCYFNCKKMQVILSTLRFLTLCHVVSVHFTDDILPLWHKANCTIHQGLLHPERELYPILTIFNWSQPGSATRVSYTFVILCSLGTLYRWSLSFLWVSMRLLAASSLPKGISSTLDFHKNISADGIRTRNLSQPKAKLHRLS